MSEKNLKKLRPKYMVAKIGEDGKLVGPGIPSTDPGDVDSPFVLMPRKDPAAFAALVTYGQNCEEDLSGEIKEWLEKVAKAPAAYGSQGERNRAFIRFRQVKVLL